jgi:hypothetical protein
MASKVDYESDSAVRLISDDGHALSLSVDESGQLVIGDVAIDAGLADTLVASINAWKARASFVDVQPAQRIARGYTMQEAADVWKARYLANRGPQRIVAAGRTVRTVQGVGEDYFYLDDGTKLPYAAAAAHWTWQRDNAPVGVAR